jgi:hypothetical protein
MNPLWSWCMFPFGVAGMILAGRRNAWGWAVSFSTQGMWAAYAINTQQWGFLPGTASYAAIYARNFLRWRIDNDTATRTEHRIDRAITELGDRTADLIRNTRRKATR